MLINNKLQIVDNYHLRSIDEKMNNEREVMISIYHQSSVLRCIYTKKESHEIFRIKIFPQKNCLDEENLSRENLSPAIVSVHNDEKKLSFNEFLSSLYRGTFGLKSCQAERASRKNQVQAFQTSESRPMSSSLIPTHDREVRPKIQSSSVE